ncbi:hypothetical protein B296_00052464 [Ensete ventricosum]|uniref:Uncharacterized protein n=1 Tax=Ensete ventricosum TaxID=4639 RepID=A0A426YCG1_ENSVE|nr:hypothetical protein B296_00052464 [Ensete ventricosum]
MGNGVEGRSDERDGHYGWGLMVIGKEWRRRVQRVGKGRGGEHGGGLTVVSPLPHGSKEGQWRCHLCLTEQWKGRGNGRRGGRVAALCVQYEAEFRPNMSIVVKALSPLLVNKPAPPPAAVPSQAPDA